MPKILKIEYNRTSILKLNKEIIITMKKIGYNYIGEGYNFKTKKFDLTFD